MPDRKLLWEIIGQPTQLLRRLALLGCLSLVLLYTLVAQLLEVQARYSITGYCLSLL